MGFGGGRVRCALFGRHGLGVRGRGDIRRCVTVVVSEGGCGDDGRDGDDGDLTRDRSTEWSSQVPASDLAFFYECRVRGLQRPIDPSLGLPWTWLGVCLCQRRCGCSYDVLASQSRIRQVVSWTWWWSKIEIIRK